MADILLPSTERFVGRDHELRVMAAACRRAACGRGSVAVVSGEPGVGKTRFCEEVTGVAEGAGLTVVDARCWVDGGAPALWPWQPILQAVCGPGAADLLGADAAGAGGEAPVERDRFARFQAVTERLAAASARSPHCVIVDDAHAADDGSLLLARFVARAVPRLGLLLVLTRRPRPSAGPGAAPGLLDEIERTAMPLVLRPFDLAEAGAFLADHGWDGVAPELVRTVHAVTGGNPLFLRRVAADRPPGDGQALPDGVRSAIAHAVGGMATADRHVLQAASVLGAAPSVADAAVVARASAAAVLDAVAGGRRAGLVEPVGADRFAFTHELVRSVLEAGLPAADRLDSHARAFAVAGGDEDALGVPSPAGRARLAHHALAAAQRSAEDAEVAVAACRAAAASMVASFAYEQADALLSTAVGLHGTMRLTGPSPGLLVEWARAAHLCGRLSEARMRFERAATVAERAGDPVTLAEAALGLGGHWLNEHRTPVDRARVLGLQRAALAALDALPPPGPAGPSTPSEDVAALRARLTARLAAEATYDGAPIAPVLDALDAARACGDPLARAEALSLCHHALLAPEHARSRLGLADELVRVASEAGHGVLALMGLCWRAVDLFLLGDPGAGRALAALRERTDALASQNIAYIVDALDVMLLARAGRLAEAEAAAQRCYELGVAVGEADALAYLGAHMLAIRWAQGRDTELLDLAEGVAASPSLVQAEFAFRATAAALAARAGHHDRAAATLADLRRDGLAALPTSSTWLAGMTAVVEVAVALDDATAAREAYDLLAPHADLPVMPSLGVVCLGSTQRPLGLAALAVGDIDRAVEHLEAAVTANRRLGNRPATAIVRADLAGALACRGGPGDATRAAAELRTAVDAGEQMGLTGRVTAWRDTLAGLDRPSGPPGAATARRGVIARHGRGWRVAADGREALVPDLVGMRRLAELLTSPGQAVPAVVLAGGDAGATAGPQVRQEVLDATARHAYAERARELAAEVDQAEQAHDLGRAERLRVELDALVDHLESAAGLGGRARAFTDDAERARTAVRKSLKRAIDQVTSADPVIGSLLQDAVETGTTCTYRPRPGAEVSWSTR